MGDFIGGVAFAIALMVLWVLSLTSYGKYVREGVEARCAQQCVESTRQLNQGSGE